MSSVVPNYDWDFDFPGLDTAIEYTRSINSVFSTTGATISVVNFSSAKPVDQKIRASARPSQSIVAAAVSKMRKSLMNGNRPSITVNVSDFDEPSSEDTFWIRVSQSEQLG